MLLETLVLIVLVQAPPEKDRPFESWSFLINQTIMAYLHAYPPLAESSPDSESSFISCSSSAADLAGSMTSPADCSASFLPIDLLFSRIDIGKGFGVDECLLAASVLAGSLVPLLGGGDFSTRGHVNNPGICSADFPSFFSFGGLFDLFDPCEGLFTSQLRAKTSFSPAPASEDEGNR